MDLVPSKSKGSLGTSYGLPRAFEIRDRSWDYEIEFPEIVETEMAVVEKEVEVIPMECNTPAAKQLSKRKKATKEQYLQDYWMVKIAVMLCSMLLRSIYTFTSFFPSRTYLCDYWGVQIVVNVMLHAPKVPTHYLPQ